MLLKPFCLALVSLLATCPIVEAQAPLGRLRVKIIDAQTRKPIAARLMLRASDGMYPGDRIGLKRENWPNLEAHGVFIDGDASFELPPGKSLIKASCGPQYEVASQEIEVVAGQTATLELPLRHRIDLRKLGWVCGDAHLHMIHGEMQRKTSYADIALTCRANGLDWAYVNQEYGGAGESTLDDYHAECRKVSIEGFQLLLGAERPKSLLGHYALMGVENPFVVPDDPPYHTAAKSIHDQGGILFPVHPVRYFPGKQYQGEWLDFPGNNLGRGIVFDAYLGPSFDGLSVLSDEPNNQHAHQLWWNLLNKGFFVPAFADSDACFDRPILHKNVPGFWATYLYLGPQTKIDNASLAEAVRQGRTMATTGPLILWNIDQQMSGATIPADGKQHEITIEAFHAHHNWTLEEARIAKVELIRNGEVVRVWEPNTPDAKLSLVVSETNPCWYAVRAIGSDPRWQIGIASPIYFGNERKETKRKPLTVRVRGRIYDFVTGNERKARIAVARHDKVLKEFDAGGQFAIDMPLDATISAIGDDGHAISHNLLLDYRSVHHFLWKLDSQALSKPETFEQFESLVREVDLEFPVGYRMSGCYSVQETTNDVLFKSLKVVAGPRTTSGPIALATVLLDKRRACAGDVINTSVVFHDPSGTTTDLDPLLVVEGRAYDPRRPTGFSPLKVFDTFESKWSQAQDAGNNYRVVIGKLTVPQWVQSGSVNELEINAVARGHGGRYTSHVGLRLPLGPTTQALMVVSNWPTVPISWHDHNYGIGPLKICGKLGRLGQPQVDYRALHMTLATSIGDFNIWPERDCRGCPDSDDAVFTDHFYDQVLNDESHLLPARAIRTQPAIEWRTSPVINTTISP